MHRDLVVVGASAGGVEALRTLVSHLPPDLSASVVIVLHIPAGGSSALPAILARRTSLPVSAVVDGQPLKQGHIYVARPDHHTLVQHGELRLSKGPTENGYRPAVDVLFRSAALARGPAVIGVILSGALDDGTAGMAAIKSRGGLALVQSPHDAVYSGMPDSVLQHVEVDHVAPVAELGPLIARRVGEWTEPEEVPPASEKLRMEVEVSRDNAGARHGDVLRFGATTTLTCPDCAGSLVAQSGEARKYRCLVGHAWTPDALLDAYSGGLERAMWMALRTLDEKISLTRRMASDSRQAGRHLVAERYNKQEEEALAAAAVLRNFLLRAEVPEDTGS